MHQNLTRPPTPAFGQLAAVFFRLFLVGRRLIFASLCRKPVSQVTLDVHRYRLRGGQRRRLVGEEGLDGEHGMIPPRKYIYSMA